jgi:hypothetical protein
MNPLLSIETETKYCAMFTVQMVPQQIQPKFLIVFIASIRP